MTDIGHDVFTLFLCLIMLNKMFTLIGELCTIVLQYCESTAFVKYIAIKHNGLNPASQCIRAEDQIMHLFLYDQVAEPLFRTIVEDTHSEMEYGLDMWLDFIEEEHKRETIIFYNTLGYCVFNGDARGDVQNRCSVCGDWLYTPRLEEDTCSCADRMSECKETCMQVSSWKPIAAVRLYIGNLLFLKIFKMDAALKQKYWSGEFGVPSAFMFK